VVTSTAFSFPSSTKLKNIFSSLFSRAVVLNQTICVFYKSIITVTIQRSVTITSVMREFLKTRVLKCV